MRRLIARLGLCWRLGFIALMVSFIFFEGVPGLSGWLGVAVELGLLILMLYLMNMAPRATRQDPVKARAPVHGAWLALNSPGQGLPSHGVHKHGQYSAMDIIRPHDEGDDFADPWVMKRGVFGDHPERVRSFGEPIHAAASGVVVEVADGQRDQRARNTWPGLIFFFTAEAIIRTLAGWRVILGNRVTIQQEDGSLAVYAHIRRRSARVKRGDRVEVGQLIAEIGNTGNTTQPHLHMQLMDRARPEAAAGIPMVWLGLELGEVDPGYEKHAADPEPTALEGMPRNGQLFTADGDLGWRSSLLSKHQTSHTC